MRDTYNDAELLKHSMQLHSSTFLNLDVNGCRDALLCHILEHNKYFDFIHVECLSQETKTANNNTMYCA